MVMGLASTEKRGWTRLVRGRRGCVPQLKACWRCTPRGATGHNSGPPRGYPLVAADLTVSLVNPIDCEEVNC